MGRIKLMQIYEALFARYGELHWWPAKTPYEVIVGAILTQNTAWSNVEKAIANFGDNLSPEFVLQSSPAELSAIIHPAGFFNQKAVYLKAVTEWFGKYRYDTAAIGSKNLTDVRTELLTVKGVGQETADSILLYAVGFPTFVVDAYTKRLCERYRIETRLNYEEIKKCFENGIPKSTELYNNYHALIVINAKEHCRAKPLCNDCPLEKKCNRFGL